MRNVLGASTAALCLGGLLAACGSEGGDGYVAAGPAAAGPERGPGRGVAPTGDVELVPLDGDSPSGEGGAEGAGDGEGGRSESAKPGSDASDASGSSDGSSDQSGKVGKAGNSPGDESSSGSPVSPGSGGSSTGSAGPGPAEGSSGSGSAQRPEGGTSGGPSSPGGGSSAGPDGPAKLSVGEPRREAAADRWCEKVTVSFHNTGGSSVRSGTVTFGTHIIGALGVDWATVESTRKLPAPIGAGKRVEKTWTVCVAAWRVPLGMHVETQDVSVEWK